MSAHLRYLATVERTERAERRREVERELDDIVRRVDDGTITTEVAIVKIAVIEERRR